jgi:hypothetical protein
VDWLHERLRWGRLSRNLLAREVLEPMPVATGTTTSSCSRPSTSDFSAGDRIAAFSEERAPGQSAIDPAFGATRR